MNKKNDFGEIHIYINNNKVRVTALDKMKRVITDISCDEIGFRESNFFKSTEKSLLEVVGEKLIRMNIRRVKVFIKGFGEMREKTLLDLKNLGIKVISIKDATFMMSNGTKTRIRTKKANA